VTPRPGCRSCGSPLRRTFVDLGEQPLANALLSSPQDIPLERRHPLHVRVCDQCLLVQADAVVAAEDIFSDYAYFSSYSDTWLDHARGFCHAAMERFGIDRDSCVVEVASNDGYLLRHFVEAGVPVLGIEPAANVAAAAQAAGIPTEVCFLGAEVALDLHDRGVEADLLVANNVMAHVPDLDGFISGLATLLAPDGVLSIEVAHVEHLIAEVQFDTVYHEHYAYWSLYAAERALARRGLRVFDVETLSTHGGSLRLFACHASAPRAEAPGPSRVRDEERAARLDRLDAYAGFGDRVAQRVAGVRGFLDAARSEGRLVVGYGAAAKGSTLLNTLGVTTDEVAYVVDRSPHKQGRLLPGSHIPVRAPETVEEDRPDYLLILAWNLVGEVTASMSSIRRWGGRFVTTMPEILVLP
jgi:SAM-dependent methyltransferase